MAVKFIFPEEAVALKEKESPKLTATQENDLRAKFGIPYPGQKSIENLNDITPAIERKKSIADKCELLEYADGISANKKAEAIVKIILNSFLADKDLADPAELINFVSNLKIRKPETAVKLLIDTLKLNQQEKLFRLKEKKLDAAPRHAPIIIVNSQQNLNNADPAVQYLSSSDEAQNLKPRMQINVTKELLDSDAEQIALEEYEENPRTNLAAWVKTQAE